MTQIFNNSYKKKKQIILSCYFQVLLFSYSFRGLADMSWRDDQETESEKGGMIENTMEAW